jgi:hypothetical protein
VAGVERVPVGAASAGEGDLLLRQDDSLLVALLAFFIAALLLVEAALLAPGHVLAGQIVDGVLLLALLNVPVALRGRARSGRAQQSLAAMRSGTSPRLSTSSSSRCRSVSPPSAWRRSPASTCAR